jgi:multisubunit Na+/H+ antiporter MnhB subunit
VTSPNITLTLQLVPVAMAGAAGGALQTAQRIGASVGVAVLATIYYQVLAGGHDEATTASAALLCASGIMLLALLVALAETARPGPARVKEYAPVPRPEHNLQHI